MRWLAAVAVLLVGLSAMAGEAQLSAPASAATGFGPSPAALKDIPANYLALYQAAGARYGVDWAVLAGIGSVETDHGRSTAPGVHSGVNSYGCCAGPMQFSIVGHPSTWDTYGQGGNVYDPADAIPATARYLVASGAPADYHRAIFAYNHSDAYVQAVMAKAAEYRAAVPTRIVAAGIRGRILAIAERSLSIHTHYFRYSQAGPLTNNPTPPPPDRTDCSQWVRAVYLQAGAPDPGLNTVDEVAKGTITTRPQPGDLMLDANIGHVELYLGHGRTWGHGSPPIDGANVSDFPGHFFIRALPPGV